MTRQIIRTKVVLFAITAMFLSSCVGQDGLIANLTSPTSELVPITETVEIPTATEAPTSTLAPIPTETPEPTPTATKWPPASPWGSNYIQEHLTYGYEFGFGGTVYPPELNILGKLLAIGFADFHYEALEITEKSYFLTGSIVDKSRSHRGERYPVKLKINNNYLGFSYFTDGDEQVKPDTEELIRHYIVEDKHYAVILYVMDKEIGRPIFSTDLEWEEGKTSQEKWREARLLVNDLMRIEGGSSERYEFVLSTAGSASALSIVIP